MLISRAFLRARYTRTHLGAAALVLCGFAILVLSDALCRRGTSSDAASRAPLLGDVLTLCAACLYAASNVLQESLLQAAPPGEVLLLLGALGAALSGVQCAALESPALAAVRWDQSFVGPLAAFALAMFCIYSAAPAALSRAGAAAFNLHMLSSDLWAAAARAALFGGFGCGGGGFAAALLVVAAGLWVYVAAPPPAQQHGVPAGGQEEEAGLLSAAQGEGEGEELCERGGAQDGGCQGSHRAANEGT